MIRHRIRHWLPTVVVAFGRKVVLFNVPESANEHARQIFLARNR